MCRGSRRRARSLGREIVAVFLVLGVPPALAGPLAYLSNLDDPSVTVVDTTSLTETATIPLPGMPSAIVAGASGTRVYVSYLNDTPTGGLAVIDVATHAVKTVWFGQVAAGLDVDAAESRAFVADVAEVAVVDLAGPSLATTFSDGTRFPFDVAIDHYLCLVGLRVPREIGGIMPRLRSWIFVSLALVIFPLDGSVFGATRPTAAQRCAAAKIAAAAKKTRPILPAARREPLWAARLIPRVF
jgi:YVTN family beta-propeller protein